MTSHNFEALRAAVLAASRAKRWSQAVQEWHVIGVEEDPQSEGVCVCGKTGLTYLFTIRNHLNQRALFPIGSSCVNLFGVEELDLSVNVIRRLFDLKSAFAEGQSVELTKDFFSRAVLADLWQNGAFPPNDYNRFNGDNDYKFMLDMFNQRHDFTENEARKVWVLINRTIKPFVLRDQRLG